MFYGSFVGSIQGTDILAITGPSSSGSLRDQMVFFLLLTLSLFASAFFGCVVGPGLFVLSSSALSRRANKTFSGFNCPARPSSRMIRSYTFVLHIHFEAFPFPSPWPGFGVVRGFWRCWFLPPFPFLSCLRFRRVVFSRPLPPLPPPPALCLSFASCISLLSLG